MFTRVMARAYALGLKTRTRRIINPKPVSVVGPLKSALVEHPALGGQFAEHVFGDCFVKLGPAPYGRPGDELVFLTGWATEKKHDKTCPANLPKSARIWSWFDGDEKPDWCGRLRMARHMPGWLRGKMPRSDLLDVKVERVQDITEADAIAEGCSSHETNKGGGYSAKTYFAHVWEGINGPGAWDRNDWVFALEFTRHAALEASRT